MLNLTNLHPSLLKGVDHSDLGEFIGQLLQTIQDLEEKRAGELAQFEKEKNLLKRERDSILADKEKLLKFQAFVIKFSKQFKETESFDLKYEAPRRREVKTANTCP